MVHKIFAAELGPVWFELDDDRSDLLPIELEMELQSWKVEGQRACNMHQEATSCPWLPNGRDNVRAPDRRK